MWEDKPVRFLLMATAAILVGTIVTMVAPFAWVNTEEDRIEGVTPYNALQLAGRDVYIREGCNNCHTQTVRPLVADVLRYGPYSRSGEFRYDRPHLWGSRRTGPDLARVGGKYPDAWHYQHLADPQSMVPESNMPAYAFLSDNPVDPELTRRKMEVLGFPVAPGEIEALSGKTEMDALVAYLQKLGTDIGWREKAAPKVVGEPENPFRPEPAVIAEGRALYAQRCAQCHGPEAEGDIGPEIGPDDWEDADLFRVVFEGVSAGGMPSFAEMGSDRIWKIVTFLRHREDD
ncbi:MAG: cytochrome C oxidase Cbb3 [Candidatus Dadabacteria bacterium]|nr:MAG: cytochrome C oxidase Cbb3 [Candidatus Dadabacteria bacterium]